MSNIDLINQLSNKSSTHLPPDVEVVRDNVIIAMGEMISYGARVRPLMAGGNHVGYIRGLRASERHWVNTMYVDDKSKIQALLGAATTLTPEDINNLTFLELRRLMRKVTTMSKADYSLTAWAYPYSTTLASEKMWAAGIKPPSGIKTPFGDMRVLGNSEVYTQWAWTAQLREDVKSSIKHTQDAVMLVRAQVGKAANNLSNEVNAMADSLKPNVSRPWLDMGIQSTDIDYEDGWGHTFQDQSLEGLMREYHGMLNDDKHEQFIRECMIRQRDAILAEQERVKNIQGRVAGISMEERIVTPEDMAKREEELRAQEAQRAEERRNWVDAVDKAATGAKPWHFDL